MPTIWDVRPSSTYSIDIKYIIFIIIKTSIQYLEKIR
jgi:hypothetical protein